MPATTQAHFISSYSGSLNGYKYTCFYRMDVVLRCTLNPCAMGEKGQELRFKYDCLSLP